MTSGVMIRLSGVSGDTSSSRRSDVTPDQVPPARRRRRGRTPSRRRGRSAAPTIASATVRSSLRAKTFGFMMRPAVCSRVVEQALDLARLAAPHQLEDFARQLVGQVVDERRRVVRRDLLQPAGRSPRPSGRPAASAPALRTQLADALHRQLRLALDQDAEDGLRVRRRAARRRSGRGRPGAASGAGSGGWRSRRSAAAAGPNRGRRRFFAAAP